MNNSSESVDLIDLWHDIMDNKSDQRTRGWFMMSSPLPTMLTSLTYILIAKIYGPRFMQNRKAFNIEKIQLVYNTLHLTINLYLFKEAATLAWFAGYSYRCQSADLSNYGTPLRIAEGCWWYFFSKFSDFFETFIFILGKRYDLVNFYHVAHHSIMPVSVWWGVKFLPGGHATFFGYLNTFVHIVIYSYLVLVGAFPRVKQYFTWWRTFLPFFQIAQFALILLHAFQLIVKNDCNFPMAFVYFIGGHGALFYFILMYELKWSKSRSNNRAKHDDKKQHLEDEENILSTSHLKIPTKSQDIVFNYDSFVKILGSKKRKTSKVE